MSCCGRSGRGQHICLDGSRRHPRTPSAEVSGEMPAAGVVRGAPAALALLVVLGLAGGSDGRQMKLAELNHCSRSMGASEWWDAVTGADEYGDMVTTFMHKRWGTALQVPSPPPSVRRQVCMHGAAAARERVLPARIYARALASHLRLIVSRSCTTKRGTATCPSASSRTCRGFQAARRGQRRSCSLGLGRCVLPLRCAACCHAAHHRARACVRIHASECTGHCAAEGTGASVCMQAQPARYCCASVRSSSTLAQY